MHLAEDVTPPAYRLYQLLWCAADWLYPPVCAGCGRPGERWCSACQQESPRLGNSICRSCGEPQPQPKTCAGCRAQPPAYTALRSWANFAGPIRHALHSLKYRQNLGLGEALAQHLRALLYQHRWRVDLVIPVPLSTQRLRERGYNQAGLLAFPLAIACRLTYSPYSLQRVLETRSQVGLNEKERLHNVRGAFRANPHKVRGRTALIVDDVATTGATIESCASALLEAGAVSVYGITLARALLHRDGVDTPK